MEKYPCELLARPRPLVAVLGMVGLGEEEEEGTTTSRRVIHALETADPAAHTANPFHFEAVPMGHTFPPRKQRAHGFNAEGGGGVPVPPKGIIDNELSTHQPRPPPLPPLHAGESPVTTPGGRVSGGRHSGGFSDVRQFENYIPVGVLKSAWLHKHHSLVPACVLILANLDVAAFQSDWAVQETVISDEVDRVRRSSVGSRDAHVVLVLVRVESVPVTPELQEQADARVASLRRRCDLDSKHTHVLAVSDFAPLSSAARKLNKFVREVSLEYYRQHARRLKKYAGKLDRNSQLALLVRHSFKVAHCYEFRQQPDKVLKHLQASYGHVRDLLGSYVSRRGQIGIALTEVKAAADFINFKLIQFRMTHSQLPEAIAQFREHIAAFRGVTGPQPHTAHWAWVSRQYLVFAQMVDHLVVHQRESGGAQSLPFLGGAEHPGYYYHNAARFAIRRREVAQSLGIYRGVASQRCRLVTEAHRRHLESVTTEPSPFFGGNPRLLTSTGTASSDAALAVAHLALQEARHDHAAEAIGLLHKARCAYEAMPPWGGKGKMEPPPPPPPVSPSGKRGKTLALAAGSRLRSRIYVQIADEHWNAGHAADAQRHYLAALAAPGYSCQRWPSLLQRVLTRLLSCAIALRNRMDILDFALQLCSSTLNLPGDDRESLCDDVFLHLLCSDDAASVCVPQGITALPTTAAPDFVEAEPVSEEGGEAKAEAAAENTTLPRQVKLDLDSSRKLVSFSCEYDGGGVGGGCTANEPVLVTLTITSHFPRPLHFDRVDVQLVDTMQHVNIFHTFEDSTPPTAKRARCIARDAITEKAIADSYAREKEMMKAQAVAGVGGTESSGEDEFLDSTEVAPLLLLAPERPRRLRFRLLAPAHLGASSAIFVNKLTLHLMDLRSPMSMTRGGSPDDEASASRSVSFTVLATDADTSSSAASSPSSSSAPAGGSSPQRHAMNISQPEPRVEMSIVHDTPALCNSMHCVPIILRSMADEVADASLHLRCEPAAASTSAEHALFWTRLPGRKISLEDGAEDAERGALRPMALSKTTMQPSESVPISDMAPGSTCSVPLWVRFNAAGSLTISASLRYLNGRRVRVCKNFSFELLCHRPFTATFECVRQEPRLTATADEMSKGGGGPPRSALVPVLLRPLAAPSPRHSTQSRSRSLAVGQAALLQISVRSGQQQPLRIQRIEFIGDSAVCAVECGKHDDRNCAVLLNEAAVSENEDQGKEEEGADGAEEEKMMPRVILGQEDNYSAVVRVRPSCSGAAISFGRVRVHWRCHENISTTHHDPSAAKGASVNDCYNTVTDIPVPSLAVEKAPFLMAVSMPPTAKIGEAFDIVWTIHNDTMESQSIKVALQGQAGDESLGRTSGDKSPADNFLWAGVGQQTMHIEAAQDISLRYTLVPLKAGQLRLPEIILTSLRHEQVLNPSADNEQLQAHCYMFVYP